MGITLAIDPGTEHSGWVVYCCHSKSVIAGEKNTPNAELKHVLIPHWSKSCDRMAIEVIAPMGARMGYDLRETLIETGIMIAIGEQYVQVRRIERMDVKRALLGKTSGNDAMVNAAVKAHLCKLHNCTERDLKGTKAKPGPCYGVASHMWAALAVAVVDGMTA